MVQENWKFNFMNSYMTRHNGYVTWRDLSERFVRKMFWLQLFVDHMYSIHVLSSFSGHTVYVQNMINEE